MNFLRGIFFGLVQLFEYPANAVLDLWRLPGRGRGLLLGFPAIFALLLTLLAVGWAKYGSNQEMLEDYWRVHQLNRIKLAELTQAINSAKSDTSALGDVSDAVPGTTVSSGPNEGVKVDIARQIQREIFEPSVNDLSGNPQIVVRAQLDENRVVTGVEVRESSGLPEWDKAVCNAVLATDAFQRARSEEFVSSNVDLTFGLLETRREKLLYSMIIGLKKLIDLDASKPEFKYEYGLLSAEMGNMAQARLMMDQIASAEKPGMAKAHLWQARQIWADKSGNESATSRQSRCMNHLRLALASDPNNIEANEGIGELYFSVGNFPEAEKHFRLVWEKQLSPTLRLVTIYKAQNDKVKEEEILSKAKLRLQEELKNNPDNLMYVYDIERICILQKRIDEAIDTLMKHVTDENRDEIYSRVAQLYCNSAKEDAKDNGGVFSDEAFAKCKKAYEYDPDLPDVLWILTAVGAQASSHAAEALALYDPVKNRADAPPVVLREYASSLIGQKKYREAIDWLENAYERFENDPITANNLAYLLISAASTPDPARALTIISKAIDRMPADAETWLRASLYDTKAAALVALNRHVEAIPFLEASLQYRVNHKETLVALRDCYKVIGRQEIADFYQRLLDAQQPASDPPK